MKHFVFIILFFISLAANSQADTAVFYQNTAQKINFIPYFVTINTPAPVVGQIYFSAPQYTVFQTGTGQHYIKYTGTDAQIHRRYLGWITAHTYEKMTVYSNKDTTRYWYLQPDKNGLPYRVKLPAYIFK